MRGPRERPRALGFADTLFRSAPHADQKARQCVQLIANDSPSRQGVALLRRAAPRATNVGSGLYVPMTLLFARPEPAPQAAQVQSNRPTQRSWQRVGRSNGSALQVSAVYTSPLGAGSPGLV
jgi:hypothetical protein